VSWLDDLAEGVLGPEDQRSDSLAEFGARAISSPGQLFSPATSMASMFTAAGDGIDLVGGLTGKDPFSGMELSGGERWMSLLGIGFLGAGVVGGAMMTGMGLPPAALLQSGAPRRYEYTVDPMDMGISRSVGLAGEGDLPGGRSASAGRVVAGPDDVAQPDPEGPLSYQLSNLTKHHNGLQDPDRVFMTTGQFTNDILKVNLGVNPETGGALGYDTLGQVIVQTAEGPGTAQAATQASKFMQLIGGRLMTEVPSFVRYADRLGTGDAPYVEDPGLLAAAWVTARFQWAVDMHPVRQTPFRFEGAVGELAITEWNKLQAGEAFDADVLSSAMVGFMKATEWISHPELDINPVVQLGHVNLDGPNPMIGLSVLEFDPIPLGKMVEQEMSNRAKALATMHPSALVGIMVDNLRQMIDHTGFGRDPEDMAKAWPDLNRVPEGLEQGVGPGYDVQSTLRAWRNWYPQAREDLQSYVTELMGLKNSALVTKHLDDPDRALRWLITVASILSAGEEWETNVQKAVDIARAMEKYPDATPQELHQLLTTPGAVRPRHGFMNMPSKNSAAVIIAQRLMRPELPHDTVRDFMDLSQDMAEDIIRNEILLPQARQQALQGMRDEDFEFDEVAFQFENPDFDESVQVEAAAAKLLHEEYGVPMREGSSLEDDKAYRDGLSALIRQVRQHVYHMSQEAMAAEGLGDTVTLFRGTSGRPALPTADQPGMELQGTTRESMIAQQFADAAREGEVYEYEVPREDVLFWHGAKAADWAGEDEFDVPAEVLRETTQRAPLKEPLANTDQGHKAPAVGERAGIHLDLNGRVSGLGPKTGFSMKRVNSKGNIDYGPTVAWTTGVVFSDVRPDTNATTLNRRLTAADPKKSLSQLEMKTPLAAFTGVVEGYTDSRKIPEGAVEIDFYVDMRRNPDGSPRHTAETTGFWYVKDGTYRKFLGAENGIGIGGGTAGMKARTYVYGNIEYGEPVESLRRANHDFAGQQSGEKISLDDVVRVKLLDGVEDPIDFFRIGETKKRKQLSLKKMADEIANGVPVEELVGRRAIGKPWESLKQDSFAYGIYYSREEDMAERAEYMARLMAGDAGWERLQGERVPHENLTRALPVVADRQHYKAVTGISLNPASWFTSHRYGYNPAAQAAAIVAAELGVIDGRQVTPEEVQAIAWMRYRSMSHWTDPLGKPWPTGIEKNPAIGQTFGFRRPITGSGQGWTEGHGPDVMFSNGLLRWVTGEATMSLPSLRTIDAGTDLTKYHGNLSEIVYPVEGEVSKVTNRLEFEIAPDGTAKLLTDTGTSTRRNRYASLVRHNGKNVLLPRSAQRVDSVTDELERIQATVRKTDDPNEPGLGGARVHSAMDELPSFDEGPMMMITAMVPQRNIDNPELTSEYTMAGFTPSIVHRRTLMLFKENGIEVEVRDLNPHEGKSYVFHDEARGLGPYWDRDTARAKLGENFESFRRVDTEPRQARVFVFKSADDMQRAAKLLHSTAADTAAARGALSYMDEFFPRRRFRAPRTDRFDKPAARKRFLERAKKLTEWYLAQPMVDPEALPLYEQFFDEVKRQYIHLSQKMGIQVEVRAIDYSNPKDIQDPYETPAEMLADINENGRLVVAKTTPEGMHPIYLKVDPETGLSNNDMFRAVHDFFGHAVHENGLTRWGEDVAFLTHAQMFPEHLWGVLASETRTQNSALITLNEFDDPNPQFVDQKLVITPPEFLRDVKQSANFRRDQQFDRHIDLIYKDEVPDVVYYADTDEGAPEGTVGVWEHHATDATGRQLVVMSPSGGQNTPHAVRAYIEPGSSNLGSYVTQNITGRFEPGGTGEHVLKPGIGPEAPGWFDGRVRVLETGPEQTIVNGDKTGSPFDLKVDGKTPKKLAVYMPLPGSNEFPTMALGDDAADFLRGLFPADRVVEVEQTTIKVKKPASSELVNREAFVYDQARPSPLSKQGDMVLAQDVETLLASISSVPANGRRIVPKVARNKGRKG
jgi:hypothetical protein